MAISIDLFVVLLLLLNAFIVSRQVHNLKGLKAVIVYHGPL